MTEGQEEYQPFGPLLPENVTADEYALALTALREFAESDLTQLTTLDEWQDLLATTGSNLHTVIVSSGKIEEVKFDAQHPVEGVKPAVRRSYVIEAPVGNNNTFRAISFPETVALDRGDATDEDNPVGAYTVIVPKTLTALHNADAVDYENGGHNYRPAQDRTNPAVQQTYARFLQTATRDMLSAAKPPTTNLPPL